MGKWLIGIAAAGALVLMGAVLLKQNGTPPSQAEDLAGRLEMLRSLPYATMTEDKVTGQEFGVVLHKPEKACRGYNLYCSRISPEVILIDMRGEVLHRWSTAEAEEGIWDEAVMLKSGDIVVIVKFKQLLRLDWHSNLIWKRDISAHHDVTLSPENTLYVIERTWADYRDLMVRFPSIAHLTADGSEIEKWSSYEHLDDIRRTFDQRSFLDTILDSLLANQDSTGATEAVTGLPGGLRSRDGHAGFDYLHLNTVSVIPETSLGRTDSRFRAGNLMICFRNVNQIAVLDKDTWDILWVWGEGILDWPHHPTMLESGNILIFDNGFMRKYSKVLEFNPATDSIEWEYLGKPVKSFFTSNKGSAQRLPNGNTLICQGNRGRAFEVSREGEIVWEWLNPMTEEDHRVHVYRMMRLPPDMVEPLLKPGQVRDVP